MAPSKNKSVVRVWEPQKLLDYSKKIIFDPFHLFPICCVLFAFELILNVFVIETIKYTEIDWLAYMQEVEGFINGTLDYSKLRGDTGSLVYPAGFVYVYSILYYITSHGSNIYLAQYIFLVLYLLQLTLFYRILLKTVKIPPYALILTTLTSYRIHSIFVLRLFNDPIAVLLFYLSLNFFLSNKWIIGSVFYSLAVSIKMNILLYAPCLLIAYLTNLSYLSTVLNLSICALVQIFLALPFLYGNFWAYIKNSFDLGRVFNHQWTVNYRFLSIEIFENRNFHFLLLFLHLGLLLIFCSIFKVYLRSYYKLSLINSELDKQIGDKKNVRDIKNRNFHKSERDFLEQFEDQLRINQTSISSSNDLNYVLDDHAKNRHQMLKINRLFVLPFFVCNLIGISCARSLHYQFYSWYFHSLLYLVFSTEYSKPVKFLILGVLEHCWNVYPSTNLSSLLLHFCHFLLLLGLYKSMKL